MAPVFSYGFSAPIFVTCVIGIRPTNFPVILLMPMTHIPEIRAKNYYQKTDTISRHENRALFYLLPETGTGKIRYKIACQTLQKQVADFW